MKKEILALSTLVGSIVGVGIFSMPYAFAGSGFYLGVLYLAVFSVIMTLSHLAYGEVILRTHQNMRFFGYAKTYLGKWTEPITMATSFVATFGSMLAYLVVGGGFLKNLAGLAGFDVSGGDALFVVIFWAIFSVIVMLGIKAISKAEFWMTLGLVAIVLFLFFAALPFVKKDNFVFMTGHDGFLPYGIVLFALSGAIAIPEIRDILRDKERSLKRVIIAGTMIPAVLYFIFAWSVVGVTGTKTTSEAISGLGNVLGPSVVFLGLVFGFLAIATSYMTVGIYLKDLLALDLKAKKYLSVSLVVLVPIVLYFLGITNFLGIIGFIGAVAVGSDSVMTLFIYLKARRVGQREAEFSLSLPAVVVYLFSAVFMGGVLYEIFSKIK
jgi:amino acid permease